MSSVDWIFNTFANSEKLAENISTDLGFGIGHWFQQLKTIVRTVFYKLEGSALADGTANVGMTGFSQNTIKNINQPFCFS
jgi:hypothetical protein